MDYQVVMIVIWDIYRIQKIADSTYFVLMANNKFNSVLIINYGIIYLKSVYEVMRRAMKHEII